MNEMYTTRKALSSDTDTVLTILEEGKQTQRANGFVQWGDDFPDRDEVADLIESGMVFLFLCDGKAAGTYTVITPEPAYDILPDYAGQPALHKTALSSRHTGKGLSDAFFSCMEQAVGADSVWIDTHPANKAMRHILQKRGYEYLGEVTYPVGKRLAYRKTLRNED